MIGNKIPTDCDIDLNLILEMLSFRFQIQHPRSRLDRFDLVVTPRHDYYALTAGGQEEIPRLFRRWITPQEPPGRNVVCCFLFFILGSEKWLHCDVILILDFEKVQVLTVGALHQADSAALRLAAIAWHDELAPLPKPLLIVNIGGPTSRSPYLSHVAHSIVSVFGYVVLL